MELSSGRVSGALIVFLLSCFCSDFVTAIDTITASRPIRDPETIISNSSIFKFGFFSPGSSSNRYVGIWYDDDNKSAETVIWVANRNNPLKDSSGVVTISEDGNLVVLNGQKNEVVWSSNVSNPVTNEGSARLLDSGNLVLLPRNSDGSIWETFQEPTDTFMSKMKLEKMLQLSSWKDTFDPSIGSFSAGIGASNIPEVFIWNNDRPYWRSGPWNGKAFIGVFDGFDIVVDNQEGAAAYNLSFKFPNNLLSYIVLDSLGKLRQVNRVSGKEDLEVGSSYPVTECDKYDRCGGFGSCDAKKKVFCSCLRGFVPKNVEEWSRGYSASGCVRRRLLQCERISRNGEVGKADGFLKLGMMKVPDFAERSSVPEVKCKEQCLNNCSCIAYAYDAGIGCMTWRDNLIDLQKFSSGGTDLYIRVADAELDKKDMKVVVIVSVVVGVVAIAICTFFLWWWMAKRKATKEKSKMPQLQDLPVFNFEKLAIATNNFNLTNKLGQGGFGPVYKGVLQDGQEIAVKRLSKASGQGLEEFMNEVMVISKLQHRNLVRLLGCCVEREEKMLIYELMPNKSLDAFIFDPLKQELLDWSKRFNIIEGISRGLMYLHRDSRLRIIHRDLKPSNILLDEELNPKISDFGMARIFGGNQDQANTRRVVGTYGYMSPEYAMGGQFSEKSDVFSFGVLLLEIVSSKRNTGFYQDENSPTLLGYAWKLWNENNISALIDPVISDPPSFQSEILRCIQVGLLCVQEFVKDRPTMPTVVSMLNSEIVDLPTPKQPAFTERQNTLDSESSEQIQKGCSVNYVTVTAIDDAGCISEAYLRKNLALQGSESRLSEDQDYLDTLLSSPTLDHPYYWSTKKQLAVMDPTSRSIAVALVLVLSCFYSTLGSAIDTITSSQPIRDNETIISSGSAFELGFFSPINSSNRYVGIWFNDRSETVIWVANRNKPLKDASGVLKISKDGNLVVLNGQNEVLWSSNVSKPLTNATAQLLDSGNLVLGDSTDGSIWESFQDPTDTILSGMKLSTHKSTGQKVQLTSWKNPSDPSPGSYSHGIESSNIPEAFTWNDSQVYWRTGPWNGQNFIGVHGMVRYNYSNDGFQLLVDTQADAVSFTYSFPNLSMFFSLSSQGVIEGRYWNEGEKKWDVNFQSLQTECDVYGLCGAFGNCNPKKNPICSCLRGFEPKNIEEWNSGNWTSGCVRKRLLQCEKMNQTGDKVENDGFLKLETMKLPIFAARSFVTIEKCRELCLNNCSCIAYAYDAGLSCMTWAGSLIDIQKFSSEGGDLYIRLAHSELEKRNTKVLIIVPVVGGIITIAICTFFLQRWMSKRNEKSKVLQLDKGEADTTASDTTASGENLNEVKLHDLPLFNFLKLADATNNFHSANKLGQGGFGPVYKGKFRDGKEIAVKRLSKASRQGVEEFMNEVMVISQLQHRNLVRLLGCCVDGEEKMLIYEYMPNTSLDFFLFDPLKRELLDWRKRFNIIEGISRGLLYLHRDSRPRIIHRDLKASNILLDEELNPKISDFGMARIFGGKQDQANTSRVVGTYGYMSPEYAMEGRFSEKSDVFSFGVLLLEIVSGRKNTGFYHDEQSLSLLCYAWKLWNENNIFALIDPVISDPSFHLEILRCIQMGLLCVQEFVKDRPTMPTVISMLNSEIVDLPSPKQPAFTERQNALDTESSDQIRKNRSVNYVTISVIAGR